jgi:hypothetical protein
MEAIKLRNRDVFENPVIFIISLIFRQNLCFQFFSLHKFLQYLNKCRVCLSLNDLVPLTTQCSSETVSQLINYVVGIEVSWEIFVFSAFFKTPFLHLLDRRK